MKKIHCANYQAFLQKETEVFLVQNDIDVSEIKNCKDGEYRMAYIGTLILDYNKAMNAKNLTRASIGECVLRAAGVGDLGWCVTDPYSSNANSNAQYTIHQSLTKDMGLAANLYGISG